MAFDILKNITLEVIGNQIKSLLFTDLKLAKPHYQNTQLPKKKIVLRQMADNQSGQMSSKSSRENHLKLAEVTAHSTCGHSFQCFSFQWEPQ